MSDIGLPARRSAIFLLDQIMGEGKLMSEVIGAGALDRLAPADRARAQRLATETLRSMERIDRLLQRHLQKYPATTVRNALRIGTYAVSYTHLRAHETEADLVCRLLLEKKK